MTAMAEPTFLVDINVGDLTKWLRAMGYDAVCLPHASDAELIGRALADGRVLLTRDAEIARRRVVSTGRVRALLLGPHDLMHRLRLVADEVGLDSVGRAFTICLECNQRLRDRPKESVREVVPAYVFRTQEAFKDCPACGRVYWQGTHWARMRRVMADVAPDRQGAPQ